MYTKTASFVSTAKRQMVVSLRDAEEASYKAQTHSQVMPVR
jgi:hypothetical protein